MIESDHAISMKDTSPVMSVTCALELEWAYTPFYSRKMVECFHNH
jgi:hypothetical protein